VVGGIDGRRTGARLGGPGGYETAEEESATEEQNVLQARVAAIAVCAKITPDIQAAALFECLQDSAVDIRWVACRALWQRGVRPPEVRAVLRQTLPAWLEHNIQHTRWVAYETLEEVMQELELHGPEWHDALIEWRQYPDPEIRWAACCALWKRGTRTPELKAEICTSVSRKVYTTLEIAIWELGKLDPTDTNFIRI